MTANDADSNKAAHREWTMCVGEQLGDVSGLLPVHAADKQVPVKNMHVYRCAS